MPEAEVAMLGTVIVQQVSLKHLESLCQLLRDMSGVDPLDNVSLMYRGGLEPDMATALRNAAPKLQLRLLVPVLRNFLIGRCSTESISVRNNPFVLGSPMHRRSYGCTGTQTRKVPTQAHLQIRWLVAQAGSPMKDSLDWLTDDESGDFFSELPWFQNFPAVVPMSSALGALALLVELCAAE